MSIVEKQIQKLTQRASAESLKSGKVISLAELARIITSKAKDLTGGPTHKIRYQEFKRPFNINAYNEMQEEITFDIDILYELLQERTEFILKSYTEADLSYKAQKSQLNLIRETIDQLLITAKNTDFNFYAIIDTFNTLDKTDLNKSSKDLIDLIEGSVSLPYNIPSTKRHNLSFLSNTTSADLSIKTQTDTQPLGRNGAGTIFGNIFTDISSVWRYEVITTDKYGCELIFTFPVNEDKSLSRLTRIEIGVLPISKTSIRLLISNDNVNFIRPPQTTDKTIFEETQRMAWDFEEIPVKYIRFVITKESPDSEYSFDSSINNLGLATNTLIPNQPINSFVTNNQKWLYAYTVTNISAYKVGRSIDGLLVSKPLTTGIEKTINLVSLETEEELLPNTAIDYQIALSDELGNPITNWTAINPINRPQSNIPNIIKFGSIIDEKIEFSKSYTISTGDTVVNNSINYYSIYNSATGNYTYGKSKLYRGFDLWSKSTNQNETIKSVENNYISFSDGNKIKELYAIRSENAVVYNRLISNGSVMRSYLGLSRKIIQSLKTKPDGNVDPFTDTNPDYSILKVEHIRPTMRITGQYIRPTGVPVSVQGVQIPIANGWTGTSGGMSSIGVPILLNGQPVDINPTSVALKYISPSFTHTFSLGVNYTVKRSDDPYFNAISGWNAFPLHWRIIPTEPISIIVNSGSLLTGVYGGTGIFAYSGTSLPPVSLGSVSLTYNQELVIDYSINPDITHRVSSIHYASNEIELDTQVELGIGDSIIVTYRFIPEKIIRESISASVLPGINSATTEYLYGVDYNFNPINSTITKIIGGAIDSSNSQSCYVDFKYRESISDLITFSTWCYYDNPEPYKFNYNSLSILKTFGESVLWVYTDGNNIFEKDISELSSITLSKGWHLFIVKSLNPDIYNDAAIIKTAKLRSIDNKYLFISKVYGGEIFSEMTSNRDPMTQVTFQYLKNSVLKSDHSKFAIDSGKIYINFLPVYNEDIWKYKINAAGTLVLANEEDFVFKYQRIINDLEDNNYLLLRARLSRSHSSDGGITPKLFSYTLRIGY